MKNKKTLSKEEIKLIFKKLKINSNKSKTELGYFESEKEINKREKKDEIWVISDSTSLFNNYSL